MGMLDFLKSAGSFVGSPGFAEGAAYLQSRRMGTDPIAAMSYLQQMRSDRARDAMMQRRMDQEDALLEEERATKQRQRGMLESQQAAAGILQKMSPAEQQTYMRDPQQMAWWNSPDSNQGMTEAVMKSMDVPAFKPPVKIGERIGPDNVKYITRQDPVTGQEWEEALGAVRPPAPVASVTITDQTAYLREQGKQVAQWEEALSSGSAKAQTRLDMLRQIEPLLDSVNTGKLAPAGATVGAWMQSAGFDPKMVNIDPNLPATAEAINSVAAELTLGKIGGEGGMPANNFSNADRSFIERTAPQLSNTPVGNKVIVQTARAMANRQLDKHLAWLKYKGEKEERGEFPSQSSFEMQWITQSRNTPLFKVVKSPEELAALPKGTVFTAPDGSVRVK